MKSSAGLQRRILVCIILVIFLGAGSCKLPSPAEDPGMITSLRFSPSAFDSFKRNTDIKYTLKAPATLSVFIVRTDSAGSELLVRRLALNVRETKGSHSHTWLGDNENGYFAPIGTYIGVVEFESQHFETTVLVFHF